MNERIQRLAVDCIITNNDNLETITNYTCNPKRPLKKGLVASCSTLEPLPVGWDHVLQSVSHADNESERIGSIDHKMPVTRFLSNNKPVIQYTQEDLNDHIILTW